MPGQRISIVTKPTAKGWQFLFIPLLPSLWLAWQGLEAHRLFSLQDSSRWPFVLGPVLLAIGILAFTAKFYINNTGVTITAGPEGFLYEKGEKKFQSKWRGFIYRPPAAKGFLRYMTVADKTDIEVIYEAFCPRFEDLRAEIEYWVTRVSQG